MQQKESSKKESGKNKPCLLGKNRVWYISVEQMRIYENIWEIRTWQMDF